MASLLSEFPLRDSITAAWRGRGYLEVVKDLQHSGQRPGLGLTAERAELAIFIGQLRKTLPWRPEETWGVTDELGHPPLSLSALSIFLILKLQCGTAVSLF